jgi:hypothetical protein
MKPFNDNNPIRRIAEVLFILHVFLWAWLIYSIAKEQTTKQQTDKTQWHLVP